jgi:amino acid transporter
MGSEAEGSHRVGLDVARRGRRIGDRRVVVGTRTSPYFRLTAPGRLTARPASYGQSEGIGQAAARMRRALLGRPLANHEEHRERLAVWQALAVFSSDNLSSVAYATEAILFTLLFAGAGWSWLTMPVSIAIVAVLAIIVASYRQTLRAYPTGGGSYIVAGENLGRLAGLTAAAALLVDYVLTVSVSVTAGIAAIVSVFPTMLASHRVELSAVAIVAVAAINLRGVRDSGAIFAAPTYVFIASTLAMIALGLIRAIMGDPPVVSGVDGVAVPVGSMSLLLLMRAFADGCSAITGVEAVSNGVMAFRRPEAAHARTTLAIMGTLVGVMFLGISAISLIAGARPAENETVISQIGRAVFGAGPAYYLLQAATMGILILAANTAFQDFPRLSSLLARDGYLPRWFAFRGERLAFTTGIIALAGMAILVLGVFGGRVEALIPLYAVGVFTSITLSQAGMVRHWRRTKGSGWRRGAVINAVGATSTAIVALIFVVAKFALGAWVIVLVIPMIILAMLGIASQYRSRRVELHVRPELVLGPPTRPQRVIIPVADLTRDVVQAVRFGQTLSHDVSAVHVTADPDLAADLRDRFSRQLPGVPLTILESPYRRLVPPLVRYLTEAAAEPGGALVIVLIPEYRPRHRWQRLLFDDDAERIETALLGEPRLLVASVPYRRAA